jgi:carbon storage regulator
MLVLSRKSGEKITIGSDIVVTVIAVRGEKVKVGLDAPREVAIRRNELMPLSKRLAANETCSEGSTIDSEGVT